MQGMAHSCNGPDSDFNNLKHTKMEKTEKKEQLAKALLQLQSDREQGKLQQIYFQKEYNTLMQDAILSNICANEILCKAFEIQNKQRA